MGERHPAPTPIGDGSRARASVDTRVAAALTAAWRSSGQTQAAITHAMGENERQVQRYLKGEAVPKLSWIVRYAEAAGTSLQAILAAAELLPRIDFSAVIDGDPALAAVYKDIVRDHYDSAVRHSRELTQEHGRRRR